MVELKAGFGFSVFGTACCGSEVERKTSSSSLDESYFGGGTEWFP